MNGWLPNLVLGTYLLIFVGTFLGYSIWRIKRKKRRPPFSENHKLLRGPGEGQLREIQKLEENLFFEFALAAFAPLMTVWICLQIAVWLREEQIRLALVATALLFAVSVAGAVAWLFKRLISLRHRRLGYFGERLVAEILEPLKSKGCWVFHDVPGPGFNIDHVVIAPTGVFAIETKTRRKPKNGAADPIYVASGRLVTRWQDGHKHYAQAERQARWLGEELSGKAGNRLPVQGVLTFPYWYTNSHKGTVWVLYHTFIVKDILERQGERLNDAQIDTFARKLESLCRDVEF